MWKLEQNKHVEAVRIDSHLYAVKYKKNGAYRIYRIRGEVI